MTATAAKAVKIDSKTDFRGELMDERIPKATPVFLTYVMLNKPSITDTDSLRANWSRMRLFVQRSSTNMAATIRAYGSRPCSLNGMSEELYPVDWPGCHAVWYSQPAFFHEV